MADADATDVLPSVEIIRTKQEVRALDGDLTLLNNRVKHLELELSKAEKRIKDTSKRTKVIKSVQQRHAVKKSKIQEAREHKQVQYRKQREHILRRKEEEQRRKEALLKHREQKAKDEVHTVRQKSVKLVHQQRVSLTAKEQRSLERVKAQRKKAELRKLEQAKRAKEEQQKRLQNARLQFEQAQNENQQLQKEIEVMEKEELEWIEKVKEAQSELKGAFDRLDCVLNN